MAQQQKSVYSHDKRDAPEVPLCGRLQAQPESSKNMLLAQAGLGQVRHTVYDLPSANGNLQHEYGLRLKRDEFSADTVLGDWNVSQGTGDLLPGRDFKQLNAEAAVVGLTTSKAFADYRTTHDARLKQRSSKTVVPNPYDKLTTTFGRSTSSSIPMSDLISHSYRYEWSNAQEQTAAELVAAKKSKKPSQTRTSILQATTSHAKVAAHNEREMLEQAHLEKNPPPDGLWKMSSFLSVPPKVGYKGE